ncbi:LLM class flavin-dependent oxidoreductase [Thalassomonas viridans]|uniref:LLM class flavin-dependent oxidoreductase n=1 Tax=Thalassomonas viridans TaxID=137584 RepID=A0AAE9ZAT7_9GAMM|nr:LLM class flavin-dependent oxidoreductase [Thalassomonas viridans]WDE08027.1 LLM class flavin-dependent oxidoreductase [Thalassomonas viridans]
MSEQAKTKSGEHPVKIHWRLCQGREQEGKSYKDSGCGLQRTRYAMRQEPSSGRVDLMHQLAFAREAEELGFDSLLVDFNLKKPDPTLLALALGLQTQKIKFIIACRSGLMAPSYFVQQLNTLSHFIPGRFSLNVVAGHSPKEQHAYGDFLEHDQRFKRTEEFLAICRKLWSGAGELDFCGEYYRLFNAGIGTPFLPDEGNCPECFIAGSSPQALALAADQGDTWVSLALPPEEMASQADQILTAGKAVAIRLSVICRPTRAQAWAAAEHLVASGEADTAVVGAVKAVENSFVQQSDSYGIKQAHRQANSEQSPWLSDVLWNGAVNTHGATAIALVGSAEEIASAIKAYQAIGVSQFIFSGWPQLDEMRIFGQRILPLL